MLWFNPLMIQCTQYTRGCCSQYHECSWLRAFTTYYKLAGLPLL